MGRKLFRASPFYGRQLTRLHDPKGPDGMLRLREQAKPKDLPGLYHPSDALGANPLHCLGEELFVTVSRSICRDSLCDVLTLVVSRLGLV